MCTDFRNTPKRNTRGMIHDMEDGRAKTASSTGRDAGFWEHLTIVPFLSPSPLIDLIDIDPSEEVDGDNENATVHKQVARTPAFRDLWELFGIIKEAREIFQNSDPSWKASFQNFNGTEADTRFSAA